MCLLCAPQRGLVYLQQHLIHHWKWEPGFQSVFPKGYEQRYPNSQILSYSDSTGTHLEAIWGSNPSVAPSLSLSFFALILGSPNLAIIPSPRSQLKEDLRA